MHYLIRLIVSGEDPKDALEKADTLAAEMCQDGTGFDWYDMNGRWGQSRAYGVNSQKGKKLIEEGMKSQFEEFVRAMNHIRFMAEKFTDEQIYEEDWSSIKGQTVPEEVNYLSRYQFMCADGGGGSTYVYAPDPDVWGGRVDNQKDLKHILDGKQKLFVVPVDFHS